MYFFSVDLTFAIYIPLLTFHYATLASFGLDFLFPFVSAKPHYDIKKILTTFPLSST